MKAEAGADAQATAGGAGEAALHPAETQAGAGDAGAAPADAGCSSGGDGRGGGTLLAAFVEAAGVQPLNGSLSTFNSGAAAQQGPGGRSAPEGALRSGHMCPSLIAMLPASSTRQIRNPPPPTHTHTQTHAPCTRVRVRTAGYGLGMWEGLLTGQGFSVYTVPARLWKRDWQLTAAGKDSCREAAAALVPGKAPAFRCGW